MSDRLIILTLFLTSITILVNSWCWYNFNQLSLDKDKITETNIQSGKWTCLILIVLLTIIMIIISWKLFKR
jgi:magnesium-transporting ATPase (P-type)